MHFKEQCVRISVQLSQLIAGIVQQELICRLPTSCLDSNKLTHSLSEISSIIFPDLSKILYLCIYKADS